MSINSHILATEYLKRIFSLINCYIVDVLPPCDVLRYDNLTHYILMLPQIDNLVVKIISQMINIFHYTQNCHGF